MTIAIAIAVWVFIVAPVVGITAGKFLKGHSQETSTPNFDGFPPAGSDGASDDDA